MTPLNTTQNMGLNQTLMRFRAEGRSALIPYLTAGVPEVGSTVPLLLALQAGGADLIELGVPFSDPVADGPVIQKASETALANGVTLKGIFADLGRARAEGLRVPVILFSYYNPIYRLGLQAFAAAAKAAGVNGVLVVDLIPEAAADYRAAMAAADLETVFLTSPTTSSARLPLIDEASTGCVYHVSRTGVTGARSQMSGNLAEDLARLKSALHQPLIVGFGISRPEHVADLAGLADGIVVGSALMAAVQAAGTEQAAETARQLIEELKAGAREGE